MVVQDEHTSIKRRADLRPTQRCEEIVPEIV